jgi:tripartite-type tricarboxylate transporter receptor subunit TctC
VELVKQSYGLRMTHVPYNGAIPAMNATIAGEVSMSCGPIQAEAPQVRVGRLVAIGIASTRRSRTMPEVPLLSSPDHPGLVVDNWYGVLAPANIPRPVYQVLRDSFQKAIQHPEVRSKLEATGMELYWQDSDQVQKIIDEDLVKWRQVVQAANIRME